MIRPFVCKSEYKQKNVFTLPARLKKVKPKLSGLNKVKKRFTYPEASGPI